MSDNVGKNQPKQPGGKSRSAAQAAARDHARQLRDEQLQREKRRRMLIAVGAPVLVVILVVIGFVVVKANRSPAAAGGSPSTPAGSTIASSTLAGTSLETALRSIPATAFDAVGTGNDVQAPSAVTGTPLTAGGKPRVLYIGAEYCPYCAGERWAVVAAMSRFGTFSNLGLTSSSAVDVYPNTATLSFHGATYTSSLLSFTGVELTTNVRDSGSSSGYATLDTPTPADQQIDTTYNSTGSIPFVDFGNKYVVTGASYDVSVLAGLDQAKIAAEMSDPTTAVAKQVLGAANMMTAALCQLTGHQPAAVCTSKAVTSQQLPT